MSLSSLITATWPMSSLVDAGAIVDNGVKRRRAPAASCFQSSSSTRPRRVRRFDVDSGLGGRAIVDGFASGRSGTAQLPADDPGGVVVVVGGAGSLEFPPHAVMNAIAAASMSTVASRAAVRCDIQEIICGRRKAEHHT